MLLSSREVALTEAGRRPQSRESWGRPARPRSPRSRSPPRRANMVASDGPCQARSVRAGPSSPAASPSASAAAVIRPGGTPAA